MIGDKQALRQLKNTFDFITLKVYSCCFFKIHKQGLTLIKFFIALHLNIFNKENRFFKMMILLCVYNRLYAKFRQYIYRNIIIIIILVILDYSNFRNQTMYLQAAIQNVAGQVILIWRCPANISSPAKTAAKILLLLMYFPFWRYQKLSP